MAIFRDGGLGKQNRLAKVVAAGLGAALGITALGGCAASGAYTDEIKLMKMGFTEADYAGRGVPIDNAHIGFNTSGDNFISDDRGYTAKTPDNCVITVYNDQDVFKVPVANGGNITLEQIKSAGDAEQIAGCQNK
ncbi:MAG: hypothetical protein LBM73_01455 [Candidatus Nomurabacteria bacterium]|jgi:hypothetical protein|nr:hypothetical protein [Candidatus Nomurabacteria bacterium]